MGTKKISNLELHKTLREYCLLCLNFLAILLKKEISPKKKTSEFLRVFNYLFMLFDQASLNSVYGKQSRASFLEIQYN